MLPTVVPRLSDADAASVLARPREYFKYWVRSLDLLWSAAESANIDVFFKLVGAGLSIAEKSRDGLTLLETLAASRHEGAPALCRAAAFCDYLFMSDADVGEYEEENENNENNEGNDWEPNFENEEEPAEEEEEVNENALRATLPKRTVPSGTKNEMLADEIEAGNIMTNMMLNATRSESSEGRYYRKSTVNRMGMNPFTKKPIEGRVNYVANLAPKNNSKKGGRKTRKQRRRNTRKVRRA
jgi:hypothetical protein